MRRQDVGTCGHILIVINLGWEPVQVMYLQHTQALGGKSIEKARIGCECKVKTHPLIHELLVLQVKC